MPTIDTSSPASSCAPSPVTPNLNTPIQHPFANSTSRLEVIPNKIDIEEESRLYDQLCYDESARGPRPESPQIELAPSIFSRESIWLGDNIGESMTFARDVKISGWTNVGDKLGGASTKRSSGHSLDINGTTYRNYHQKHLSLATGPLSLIVAVDSWNTGFRPCYYTQISAVVRRSESGSWINTID
ncbi:px domain protein [Moniliophthora roreri]|nr:px domain protein [Moniliophthora roreri]